MEEAIAAAAEASDAAQACARVASDAAEAAQRAAAAATQAVQAMYEHEKRMQAAPAEAAVTEEHDVGASPKLEPGAKAEPSLPKSRKGVPRALDWALKREIDVENGVGVFKAGLAAEPSKSPSKSPAKSKLGKGVPRQIKRQTSTAALSETDDAAMSKTAFFVPRSQSRGVWRGASVGTPGGNSGDLTLSGEDTNRFFVPQKISKGLWRGSSVGSNASSKTRGMRESSLSMRRRRLLRRDSPFFQSSGAVHMMRSGWRSRALLRLGLSDWFHVVLAMNFWGIAMLVVVLYTTIMLIFAGIYMAIDGEKSACGLAAINTTLPFLTAFSFSLETMTTIGYGIPYDPEAFFNGCWTLPVAVYAQALIFIVLNAAFLGLIFARVGRAQTRASQIIFSDKAVIRCVRGRFFFAFQVAEASFFHYDPVVEAHVRAYAVLHETTGGKNKEQALFQTRVMRIVNPNDDLGGVLFLATPQLVSHRIDRWSPLFPPVAFEPHTPAPPSAQAQQLVVERPVFPGLVLREEDLDADDGFEAVIEERRLLREALLKEQATTLSEASTDEGFVFHLSENSLKRRSPSPSMQQPACPKPRQGEFADRKSLQAFREALRMHVVNSELEVIVLVEAIDPASSNTFQARHSYMAEDIEFDCRFAPAMSINEHGHAYLDWDAFHTVRPVPFNSSVAVASSHS